MSFPPGRGIIISTSREKEAPGMSTLYTLLFMVLLGGAACVKG